MIGDTKRAVRCKAAGFTLVEALVATAILSIVAMIAVNLLVGFFGNQRTARDELYVEGSSRQILSLIAERTRSGFVDYAFYTDYLGGAPSAYLDRLALRNSDGEQTVLWFYDVSGVKNLFLCDEVPLDSNCDTTVDPSASADWDQVNSSDVTFTIGKFVVQPDDSPYPVASAAAPATDEAPLITVVMQMNYEGEQSDVPVIQTSFTPRYYVR